MIYLKSNSLLSWVPLKSPNERSVSWAPKQCVASLLMASGRKLCTERTQQTNKMWPCSHFQFISHPCSFFLAEWFAFISNQKPLWTEEVCLFCLSWMQMQKKHGESLSVLELNCHMCLLTYGHHSACILWRDTTVINKQHSTHIGPPFLSLSIALSQADLMKPSLQMKHNFKDRRVVGRSRDDVCLFLLVSSCLFNYCRC